MKTIKNNEKLNIELLKYTLFFFAFVVLYNFLIVNKCHLWSVDSITYTYHLVDYSFGFATKFLPGAIYHLFFKEVYAQQLNIYLSILMLLFFAFVSFALAKLVQSRTDSASKKTLLILSCVFLSGPCTFAIFTDKLGMIDVYWVFFSALFLVFIENRYLKFAVPLIFVVLLLIHFSAVLCYILMLTLILLYRLMYAEEKWEKRELFVILLLSLLVAVALGLYFVTHEKSNLTYSMQQFENEIAVRYHYYDKTPYYLYYEYSLYDYYEIGGASFSEVMKHPLVTGESLFANAINMIYYQFKLIIAQDANLSSHYPQLIMLVVLISPLYILITSFWVRRIKTSHKLQKAVYIMFLCQFPITSGIGLCFSADVSRWLTHAFLIQFILFFYDIYIKKEDFKIELNGNRIIQTVLISVYYAVYALTYVNPYQ